MVLHSQIRHSTPDYTPRLSVFISGDKYGHKIRETSNKWRMQICRTYRCHHDLISEEVREPSSLADESLLTERETVNVSGQVIRL